MIGEIQFQQKKHAEAVKSFFKVSYGYGYPQWQADATYEAGRCFEVVGKAGQADQAIPGIDREVSAQRQSAAGQERVQELHP